MTTTCFDHLENVKMALAGEEGEELDVEGIELCAKVFDHYVF